MKQSRFTEDGEIHPHRSAQHFPDDIARVGFTYESIGRRAMYNGLNPVTIER